MLRAVTVNISDLFYERASFNWPIITASKLGYVGKTSFTNVLEMRDSRDTQFLAKTERAVVLLDRNSGEKVEIPSSRQKFLEHFFTKDEPLRVVPPAPSREIFKHNIHVTASDRLKYCMDTVADGVLEGQFKHFKHDPFTYQTEEVKILYSAEGFPGDVLTVCCWEDKDTDNTMLFEVTKGEIHCVSCSFKFHKNSLGGV